MKILFFGDIFGKPGRKILGKHLPLLKKKYSPDFIIVNAENTSHGKGLTHKHYQWFQQLGINCFTMGNHTWDKQEIYDFINQENIVRPYNIAPEFPQGAKGLGTRLFHVNQKKIRVTNLLGSSVMMKFPTLNPFFAIEEILKDDQPDIHIIDFHAETTSEKNAFRYHLDGRVSAIFCTHTHIPTFDARISDKHTFYITDVGMCGPGYHSVIGADPELVLAKFKNPNQKFLLKVDEIGAQLNAIYLSFDDETNFPIAFEQIKIIDDEC